jgi:hypothetical protein
MQLISLCFLWLYVVQTRGRDISGTTSSSGSTKLHHRKREQTTPSNTSCSTPNSVNLCCEEKVDGSSRDSCVACMTEGPPGSRWWSRTVTSGEGPGGDGFRVSFGLVKEIVAGVRLSSRPG